MSNTTVGNSSILVNQLEFPLNVVKNSNSSPRYNIVADSRSPRPQTPILLNEIQFPLEKVIVTVKGVQPTAVPTLIQERNDLEAELQSAKTDGRKRLIKRLLNAKIKEFSSLNTGYSSTDKVAMKLEEIARKTNLFTLLKFGSKSVGASGIQSYEICNKTVDMRDSFRMVVDLEDTSKLYAMACLNGSDNEINNCKLTINEKLNTLGLNVTNTYVYPNRSSYDKLGNIVVSPPTPKDVYGTILIGGQTTDTINRFISANADALKFTWKPGCTPRTNKLNAQVTANAETKGEDPSIKIQRRNAYCSEEKSYNFSKIGDKVGQKSISPELQKILSKFTSQRKINIFTGWLEVGHVDEIISFIPFSKEGSTYGFKVLLASPGKFIELWQQASNKSVTADKCLFNKLLYSSKKQNILNKFSTAKEKAMPKKSDQLIGLRYLNTSAEIGVPFGNEYCDIQIKDISSPRILPLVQFNQWIQATILNPIKTQLMEELGIPETDIIDIPILYIGPDELFNYSTTFFSMVMGYNPEDIDGFLDAMKMLFEGSFGIYHLSNNFINSLYSTKYIISPKLQDNLGIIDYIKKQVRSDGAIEKIFDDIDEWDSIKYQHGGLHCYTTEQRRYIDGVVPYSTAGGYRKTRKNRTRKTNRK